MKGLTLGLKKTERSLMMSEIDSNEREFFLDVERRLPVLKKQKVIIADGDETISLHDTSKLMMLRNNMDDVWYQIRDVFSEYGRSFTGFSYVAEIYTNVPYEKYVDSCKSVVKEIQIREYWQDVVMSGLPIIVVTSGIRKLWELVIQYHGWNNVFLFGGNNYNESAWVLCPELKKRICQHLKEAGNELLVLGDSYIDYEMLVEGHIRGLVVNERKSPNLFEACSRCDGEFYEVDEYYKKEYPGIPVKPIGDILERFRNL